MRCWLSWGCRCRFSSRCSGGLAAAPHGRDGGVVTAVLDIGANIRFRDSERSPALSRSATGADIGDEHVREGSHGFGALGSGCSVDVASAVVGEAFKTLGAAGDGDGGAVHVHFAVADLVEPGPGEGVFTRGNHGRDGEVVLFSAAASRVVLFNKISMKLHVRRRGAQDIRRGYQGGWTGSRLQYSR